MGAFWTILVLGLLLVLMGVANRMGDLRSLHSYHRKRVSAEDMPAFVKAVGLGTILCGGGCLFYAVLHLLADLTDCAPFYIVGGIGLAICMVLGIFIALYAVFKYNKGLF